MIIIGGTNSIDSVIAIDQYGSVSSLPNLNSGRWGPGCSHYTNDNDETVNILFQVH